MDWCSYEYEKIRIPNVYLYASMAVPIPHELRLSEIQKSTKNKSNSAKNFPLERSIFQQSVLFWTMLVQCAHCTVYTIHVEWRMHGKCHA